MKNLDLSAVSSTVGFPVKAGTLNFLQLAYQEVMNAIANNLLGARADSSGYYILFGCVNSGSGSTFTISAGAIYYNGVAYLVPAASFTAAGGQTAVGTIQTTQYTSNADAVLFTDGVSRNVHNISQIVFAGGTSGSGNVDFANLKMCGLGLNVVTGSTFGSSYVVKFDQDKTEEFTTASVDTTITFDFTNAVPGAVVRLKWTWGSGRTLTVTAGTGQTVLLDSGDLTKCASHTNTAYFLYAGKNTAGNDEVSYSINQTA